MQIDRCVCYQKEFKELKEVADGHGCTTIEALQCHVVFGQNCKMCHPYVRRMLKTGETVFSNIIVDQDA